MARQSYSRIFMNKRIEREKHIVNLMIADYCNTMHNSVNVLCNDCNDLKDYAEKRLLKCPFLDNKPVCSNCSIHCYNSKQKEKIKEVMRTVGPKMLFKHPKETIWYFFYKLMHKPQKVV